MRLFYKIFFFQLLFCFQLYRAQNENIFIKGHVSGNSKPLENALIRDNHKNGAVFSNSNGYFEINIKKNSRIKLYVSHPAFFAFVKEISPGNKDTVYVTIDLKEKSNLLDSVPVFSVHKPETLVGKSNYSVYDYDFYEDKLILLTAEKSLNRACLRLSDYNGGIITSLPLPKDAGTASSFFHDYEGYTDLLCSDTVFRLEVLANSFLLMPLSRQDFNRAIKPVVDSSNLNLYLSDQWEKYPLFNYYFAGVKDTSLNLLSTVCNTGLMKIYNMEYYYLPSGAQLEARRLAQKYKTDKRVIAALMSGFTQSMYYEPIYAPLFTLNDTVCVFNHYSDHIYHFSRENRMIDSVKISYHHTKNWREWKKQLFADKFENKVYAFFSKDGHHYIKEINHQNGKEVRTYQLKHHSAEKIKIRDGFVYYVYRPFGSTQEKFLYRERIE